MQRGVALLVVLWACTLLAILVGGYASVARVEATQTRFTLGQQRARYAAEAGVMQAIVLLDTRRRHAALAELSGIPQRDTALPGDGRSLVFDFDRLHVAVGILDENGKVDLNQADPRTLKALFIAAGCTAERADALATQVTMWRGYSGVAGGVAAQDDGALRLSPVHVEGEPKHAPFASIEELQSVPGVDVALYAAVEPAITVWSGQSQPQADFAPALALATLPGLDLARARQVIAIRDSVPPGTPLPNLPGGLSLGDALPGNAMTFRAMADDGHGSRAMVEATVLFPMPGTERQGHEPLYTVLRWRDAPGG